MLLSCSRLNKKPCLNSSTCKWIVGKGCRKETQSKETQYVEDINVLLTKVSDLIKNRNIELNIKFYKQFEDLDIFLTIQDVNDILYKNNIINVIRPPKYNEIIELHKGIVKHFILKNDKKFKTSNINNVVEKIGTKNYRWWKIGPDLVIFLNKVNEIYNEYDDYNNISINRVRKVWRKLYKTNINKDKKKSDLMIEILNWFNEKK